MFEEQNLELYNKVRDVPTAAQKSFNNGRFSGTDINPMWRIKTLTEAFGPVGIGWYYEVTSERSESVGDTVIAIVDLNLYVRCKDGSWSMPIYGTGGNVLLSKGKASDEGYKMALTDALSVACKALGIGADIYFEKDKTKYTAAQEAAEQAPRYAPKPASPAPAPTETVDQTSIGGVRTCYGCGQEIRNENVYNYSRQRFGRPLCYACQKKEEQKRA